MSLKDLNDQPVQAAEYDLIIIGAGPAGLAIAAEFLGSGLRVAVLESGGKERNGAADDLDAFENVGHARAPHAETRSRGLGGTSAIWTGRCGMLDDIDFHARPWLPRSGWPISAATLRPYYHRAGPYLGLSATLSGAEAGHDLYQGFDKPPWDSAVFRDAVWQFSNADNDGMSLLRQLADAEVIDAAGTGVLQHSGRTSAVNLGERLRKPLTDSTDIDIVLNATALEIEVDPASATAARSVLVARSDGQQDRFHGRRIVLACGGIENARLLLASRSGNPKGLGNDHDQVGRHLTDHHFSEIGRYTDGGGKQIRRRFGSRWHSAADSKTIYCMGVRTAEATQRDKQLLNATIHIVDFGSRLNALSTLANGARAAKQKDAGTAARNLSQALRRPGDLAVSVRDRFVRGTPPLNLPQLTLLGCVLEQELDPDSRVTLSSRTNRLGQPIAKIDWRISDREFRTARAMAGMFHAETDRLGLAPPARPDWLDGDFDDWSQGLTDLAHPSCTTRMSDDPATGVVDANCKLHGVEGVYVAGSSVFSTPGHMNPTQTILALGIRLADHLKQQILSGPSAPPASVARPRRLRIGFIGGGNRVATIYHPVTQALADRLEVVGAVTGSDEGAARIASQTGWTAHTDPGRLVAEGRPDFLVVALPPSMNDGLYPSLIGLDVPLLLETPFCWNEVRGRKLLRQIGKAGRLVGVAEQFPFLPEYQLWQKLIGLGLIGKIEAVVNDFAVYDYHGIGLLRTLMGRERRPDLANGRIAALNDDEAWALGSVRFTDGSFLINNYSASYAANPHRPAGEIRVCGTQGTLRTGQALFANGGPGGQPLLSPIRREQQGGALTALSVLTPDGEIRWDNPYAGPHAGHRLTDEQIAVAELLTRMGEAARSAAPPPYAPWAALEDVELLAALRYSAARGGAAIPLPLAATREKLRGKARQTAGKITGRLRR
ncbi:GMC oxidoreductase [Paracoccus sp. M683]|uniref:GMC oxidoreductase n=1 Tax=Paracoccus sp. M683 TaxID=2594268 RepID=UPI00163D7F72|nr:GMC oxidoreductase [Paracoccus sp. M683]